MQPPKPVVLSLTSSHRQICAGLRRREKCRPCGRSPPRLPLRAAGPHHARRRQRRDSAAATRFPGPRASGSPRFGGRVWNSAAIDSRGGRKKRETAGHPWANVRMETCKREGSSCLTRSPVQNRWVLRIFPGPHNPNPGSSPGPPRDLVKVGLLSSRASWARNFRVLQPRRLGHTRQPSPSSSAVILHNPFSDQRQFLLHRPILAEPPHHRS